MKQLLTILMLALTLTGSAPVKGSYEWRTLYVPAYTEAYKPSTEPVVALAHGKSNAELAFRVCAVVEGDGELLLSYGSEGDGVAFSYSAPTDLCVTTYVGSGGGTGEHLNHLDLYLLFYEGQSPILYRPEISVGVMP